MAKLTIEFAPPVSLPRRFLLSAPWWGMLAGLLLLAGKGGMLQSRWHPYTVATTHAFTLGLLGNTMFGSVLQFLPAAAGVRLSGASLGRLLHALLNVGLLLLVVGLCGPVRTLLAPAVVLLLAAFALLAAMTLPGVLRACGQRVLRVGIGMAIAAALVAAVLGSLLALTLGGLMELPLATFVAAHAAWGVLGWMVLLLASVARIVLPMFQGTARPPTTAVAIWTIATLVALLAGSLLWLRFGHGLMLRATVAGASISFALAALWLQWRSPSRRNPVLRAFWRDGLLILLAASLALLCGDGLVAGVLAIGIALPQLAIGMQLQINAFLGWIDLSRCCSRRARLPSVQHLLPDTDQRRVLHAMRVSASLLLIAVLMPSSAILQRAAGLAMLVAYGVLWSAQRAAKRRGADFLQVVRA